MPPETAPAQEKPKWNFWETDPKRNFTPWFLSFCAVLIVIGLSLVGYYRYQVYKIYQSTKADLAQSQVEFDQVRETRIATANWQTYRNAEYGFEIKYPEFLKSEVVPVDRGGFITTLWKPAASQPKSEVNDLTIYDDYRIVVTNTAAGISSACSVDGSNDIEFLGKKAVVNTYRGWKCGVLLGFTYDKINFSLSGTDDSRAEAIETFKQILSTFKFIK